MADDFLSRLIGNPKRARVLRTFIFNPNDLFSARLMAKRSGITAETAAKEIAFLENAGVVKRGRALPAPVRAWKKGTGRKSAQKKEGTWQLNANFKYLRALTMFVHEVSPIQYRNILKALRGIGRLSVVILSGSFVGDETRPTDILVAADNVSESKLDQAVRKMEPLLGRELRYAYFTTPELRYRLTIQDRLVRDTLDYPHVTLLDKFRLL